MSGNHHFNVSFKLYFETASLLKKINAKTNSFKSVLYQSKFQHKSKLCVLLHKILENRMLLENVINDCNLLTIEPQLDKELALVLVYELLLGKGKISAGGKFLTAVKRHKEELFQSFNKLKNSTDNAEAENHQFDLIPRYVKVNTLKISPEDCIKYFEVDGFHLLKYPDSFTYDKYIDFVKQMHDWDFFQDFHFKDLLVFAPHTNFYDHRLNSEGKIILMDKTSCLPGMILQPLHGAIVLDACAAPGNKTAHIAALMGNTGMLIANDVDQSRFSTMQDFLEFIGATSIKCVNLDFTSINPKEDPYNQVTHILIDPTCSGSGMVSRKDYLTDYESVSDQRLKSLASFQTILLKHAFTFPAVQKIVYSTCSVYCEENEQVINHIKNILPHNFRLAMVMPEWQHRGDNKFHFNHMCIQSRPDTDLTNGFFIAAFEKINPDFIGGKINKSKRKKKKHGNDSKNK